MDAAVHVVVPAVGVVVGDDDRGVRPVRCALEGVDLLDDELLLVEGVGVGGVPVLVTGGLQEADGRKGSGDTYPWAMAPTRASKSLMSYWWFAVLNWGAPLTKLWVSVPIADSDAGSRWWGLAVEA